MKNNHLNSYIKERYPDLFGMKPDEICQKYTDHLAQSGTHVLESESGFATYKMIGDALVIYDMYVFPEFRNERRSHELFNELRQSAQKLHKSVIITFSEFAGSKHELGKRAILSNGFQKVFDRHSGEVYMRSTL